MIWGYHYFRKHPCEPCRILLSDTLKGMKCTHNHQGFIPPKVLRGPDFMWFFGNIQFRHFNLTKTSLLGSNLVLRRITGSVHIVHRDRVGPGCFCLRTWDWLHPLFLEEVITHATCYQLLQKAVVSTKHMKIHLPKLGKGINIYIYIITYYTYLKRPPTSSRLFQTWPTAAVPNCETVWRTFNIKKSSIVYVRDFSFFVILNWRRL